MSSQWLLRRLMPAVLACRHANVFRHGPTMVESSLDAQLRCSMCNAPGAEMSHQHTSYKDEWDNYDVLCDTCQLYVDDFWDEQWNDWNSSRM